MIGDAFKRPVVLLVGLGFPKALYTPMDALQMLNELPPSSHGPAHTAANKACRAAIEGNVDAETVRDVVEAYAKARGLLEPIALYAIAARQGLLGA